MRLSRVSGRRYSGLPKRASAGSKAAAAQRRVLSLLAAEPLRAEKVSRIARRCGHRRPPECGYAEGFSRQRYLFTTLSEEIEAEKIVAWNGKRWNLELDLRTLKGTPRLKHLPGKSKAAVEKELLIAVVAYGFVRALKREAAERAGLHPRELSFTCARGLLNAMTGQLCSLDADQRRQAYDRLLA